MIKRGHLNTLCDSGLLTKEETRYTLGMEFIPMGEYVKNQLTIYRLGRPAVDELAQKSNEAAHLVVEHDGLEMTVYESWTDRAVATNYHTRIRGKPQYLHYSATGKAILAHQSEARVQEIIDTHGLVKRTERTITDENILFEQLDVIRDRGYAINDNEEVYGLRSIGAPVLNDDGQVLGAVSVSGPSKRVSGEVFETKLPELVLEAANVIGLDTEIEKLGSASVTKQQKSR